MSTLDRLKNLLVTVFDGEIDPDSVDESSSLTEDIGLNSIGMLYMAMAIEEEFKVRMTNQDFSEIRTVADVVNKIESK